MAASEVGQPRPRPPDSGTNDRLQRGPAATETPGGTDEASPAETGCTWVLRRLKEHYHRYFNSLCIYYK